MGTSGRGIVQLEGEKQPFNAVKVFSATMAPDRENLGDKLTLWLRNHPNVQVTDTIVTQSSDAAFHCLAITVFYWDEAQVKQA